MDSRLHSKTLDWSLQDILPQKKKSKEDLTRWLTLSSGARVLRAFVPEILLLPVVITCLVSAC